MWTASSSGPRSLKTHKPFPMVLPKGCTVQMIRYVRGSLVRPPRSRRTSVAVASSEQLGQVLGVPPDELTLGAVMYLYPNEKDLIMLHDYPSDAAAAAAAAKGAGKSGGGAEGMEMVVYGTGVGGAPGGAGTASDAQPAKENACDDLDADVQLVRVRVARVRCVAGADAVLRGARRSRCLEAAGATCRRRTATRARRRRATSRTRTRSAARRAG